MSLIIYCPVFLPESQSHTTTEDPFAGQAFPTSSSGFASDPFGGGGADPFSSTSAPSTGGDAFDPFGALSIPPVTLRWILAKN